MDEAVGCLGANGEVSADSYVADAPCPLFEGVGELCRSRVYESVV